MSDNLPEKYSRSFEEILDDKSKKFLSDFINGLPEYPKPFFGVMMRSQTQYAHNVVRYALEETEFGSTGISVIDLWALSGVKRYALHGGFTIAEDENRVQTTTEDLSARMQRLLDSGSAAGKLLVAREAVSQGCEVEKVPVFSKFRRPHGSVRVFYPIDPGDSEGTRSPVPGGVESIDFTVPVIALPGLSPSVES